VDNGRPKLLVTPSLQLQADINHFFRSLLLNLVVLA
jgi:hypothetical protein